MLKIVHIITGLAPDGAETMLYKLLGSMDRSRYENVVISLMDKNTAIGQALESIGVPVYSLGLKTGKPTLSALWRIASMLGKLRPDVIQGWMYHGNLAATLGKMLGARQSPVLWNIHHSLNDIDNEKRLTRIIIHLGRLLARTTKGIIYVSKQSAIQHERKGYPHELTRLIPNGFDCQQFSPSATAREGLLNEIQANVGDVLIGLIGRYHPVKDHASFIGAAKYLSARHPEVQYVLAGRDVDEGNKELMDVIHMNKLDARFHLLGERADIFNVMAGLDIVVSSSASEAFPLAIGEAMACGVPCVVTDVGDSAWIVGETGSVVPPRDAAALAEGLSGMIEKGPAERARLGALARQRIIDNFSLQHITAQFERLYDEVCLTPAG